jgi:hypothetical protein
MKAGVWRACTSTWRLLFVIVVGGALTRPTLQELLLLFDLTACFALALLR